MHIYVFYNNFSALTRNGVMLQALYLKKRLHLIACVIDLYTVGKRINSLIGGKFISHSGAKLCERVPPR